MKRFSSRPLPDFKSLYRALFNHKNSDSELVFFDLGRDALLFGVEVLGIKPGGTILIPAYMCNSTIEPLSKAGYKIIFFDVKDDLNFDLNMIESLITSLDIDAILSVHYFGFPTNILDLVRLCKKYNVKVIEDCAHSFLTKTHGKSVGSFGDVAIFSMRKTLGVPDGGALKINVGSASTYPIIDNKRQWFTEVLYLVSRVFESIICFIGFPNLYSHKIDELKKLIRNILPNRHNNTSQVSQALPVKSSFQLKAYLNNIEYKDHIIERRKHNYNALVLEAEKIGLKSLFPQLPDGCVPQFFILVDKKKQLVSWLREHGVGAVTWPGLELPQEIANRQVDFPVTNSLNEHLAMLPIHQSLNDNDMVSIIDLLKKWSTTQ